MLSQSSDLVVACAGCGTEIELEPQFCDYRCRRRTNRRPVAERLWEKVDYSGPMPSTHPEWGCCWQWTAHLMKNGYGSMGTPTGLPGAKRNNTRAVHRIAWELASGVPIPDGGVVGHTCDYRRCVRNDDAGTYEVAGILLPRFGHLFLCTRPQNNFDMYAKGRNAPIPHDNPHRKLQPSAAPIIRNLYTAGWTQQQIGDKFGVGQTAISEILRGKRIYLR